MPLHLMNPLQAGTVEYKAVVVLLPVLDLVTIL